MSALESELALLYRRHRALVRGCALRICGSAAAAEDVTQEVFMRYWAYRQAGGGEAAHAAAFLYRTATRCALNSLRGSRRRQTREHHSAEPEAVAADYDDAIVVRRVLAAVPVELAQIAAYYYFEGMEHDEIAVLLGMQRRTVGRRLDEFRKQGRAFLEAHADEVEDDA